MPPCPFSVTCVPDTSGLVAPGATVIDELAPVAVMTVVPCRLLIGPLRTMLLFEATFTLLTPPPLKETEIGYDALTVFVRFSVRR